MKRNVLKSSFQSAYFSIIFQVICRFITFGINAFIVRRVGRDVLGIMNVRLLLLESTLLFLSREAINRAALSSTTQQKSKCTWPQLINQMWLTVPLCTGLTLPCLYIWLNVLSPVDDVLWDQYRFGCLAIAISCIVELCAEAPLFISQVFCFVKLKIVLDTLHIFVRSVIFIWIVLRNREVAIFAFGVAQFSSAMTIILGHYTYFYFYIKNRKNCPLNVILEEDSDDNKEQKTIEEFPFTSIAEMMPGVLKNDGPVFNSELRVLTLSFVKQGIVKQILTEGEKYVMSASPVLTFSEQATYDVVNNLGSLAARFIFRPIEDSSYFYFTQTIARDVEFKKQNREKVLESGDVLRTICKIVTSIGMLALVYGQCYAGVCLLLYGGEDFVAGGLPEVLLRWHCLAILFLAINGVTEGFMFATKTSTEINKYNYYMAMFSVMFLLLSYVLTNILGPVGFILANCTNMMFRISYSIFFISKKFKHISINPLTGIIPGKLFFVVLFSTGSLCYMLKDNLIKYSILYYILLGALCVGLTLLIWAWENQNLLRNVFSKYGTKLKKN